MFHDCRIVGLFPTPTTFIGLMRRSLFHYWFMKVERGGDERVYRINWKEIVLLLANTMFKIIKK